MKTFLPLLITLLIVNTAFAQAPSQDITAGSICSPAIKGVTKDLPSEEWITKAEKNISAIEYAFKKSSTCTNFYAINRNQQLGVTITPAGYTTYPLNLSSKKQMVDY